MQQASPSQNVHPAQTVLAGMDGCRAGWIAVHTTTGKARQAVAPMDNTAVSLFATIEEAVAAFGTSAIIAVDMPIGLPEKTGAGGRGPEQAVRPRLGARQSSVFSIPSRSAVYAATYEEACHLAQETSDPPRKVSKQAFNLFPKIRQLDRFLLRTKDDPAFAGIALYECHPEFALAVLNDGTAMQLPKKIKSKVNPAGIEERRRLLGRLGFDPDFLRHGIMGFRAADAALDDFLDACACLAVALRLQQGLAHPHPEQYKRDAYGLPIAIWA